MAAEGKDTIRFGAYEFDTSLRELRKNGVPLKLQPQPAKVLAALGCLARAARAAVRAEALEERAVQVNIAAHIECAQHSDRIGETGAARN